MSQYGYIDKFLDVTAPMGPVEIEVKDDGRVIWVHTDGRTVLRICQVTDEVIINDHRPGGTGVTEPTGGQPQPTATPTDAATASQTVAQGTGGTPAHPRTREPLRAFVWPCDKRTAHESHGDCPGVMGHPLTMIGGGHEAETDGD